MFVRAATALAVCLALCGCHNLQPHRLQMLNRGPDLMGGSGYNFSVPDPIGEAPPSDHAPEPAADEGVLRADVSRS